jgi:uncharacterized metal-binding protein YceD (DUF177 family)
MNKIILPKHVNAVKNAKNNLLYVSEVNFSDLPRIQEYAISNDDVLQVKINFFSKGTRNHHLTIEINGVFNIQCQRCNEYFSKTIEHSNTLKIVPQSQVVSIKEDEVEMNEENMLNLLDLIEDEIILEIGVFPYHPKDICNTITES